MQAKATGMVINAFVVPLLIHFLLNVVSTRKKSKKATKPDRLCMTAMMT